VIYESPLTVVCDHPDNLLNQPGSDFLKIVPTVWDDIRFLGGYPGEWVAIAKRSGNSWYIGIMNNRVSRNVSVKMDFLLPGSYEAEIWADDKNADMQPARIRKLKKPVRPGEDLNVVMAKNGGCVIVVRQK